MVLSATALRKNIFEVLNNTAKYNDIVNVTTKAGNVVMMSEDDYRGLMETVYICSKPGLADKILQAADEDIEDGIPEEKIKW